MSLSLNIPKLESAGENLVNSYGYYNSAINNIASGKSGLDSEVLSSVSQTLSSASNNLDLLLRQTKELSESILNAASEYRKIEQDFSSSTSAAVAGISAGVVAAGATGATQVSQASTTSNTTEKKEEGFWAGVGNWFKRTGASIANVAVGAVKGICNFLEAVVDTAAILLTGLFTIFTAAWDLGLWIGNKLAGTNYDLYATKRMWNGVMDFVGTKWVDKGFDYAYSNWGWLQSLDENSWSFCKRDGIVYKIGEGIGYVTGVIALTLLTAGAGGAAVGAGGASSSAITIGSLSATSGQLATTAAVAGFGKGAQDKRAEGGSVLESLGAGAITAAWDGTSFYLGGKMQSQWGGQIANKILPQTASPIAKQIATSGVRVAFDTTLGAADAFTKTGIDTIGADGYYNQDGIWTEFEPGTSYTDRYKAVFEQNGGWANVGQTMATAGVMSSVTEGFEIAGVMKTRQPSKSTLEKAGKVLSEKQMDSMYAYGATSGDYKKAIKEATKEARLKNADLKVEEAFRKEFGEIGADILTASGKNSTTKSKVKAIASKKLSDAAGDTVVKAKSKINEGLDAELVKKVTKENDQVFTAAFDSTSTKAKVKAIAGDTAAKAKSKINEGLDAVLVKKVTKENDQVFTAALDSTSTKAKVKAIAGDTAIVKGTKNIVGNIGEASSKTKLGQTWKAIGQTAEETGLTRGAVTRQYAVDRIASTKVGQGVAKATTGISNLAGKTKLGQTWKAIGQTAEETGLTRGAVTRQYAVDRIAGTKVGQGVAKATTGISNLAGKTKLGQTWKAIGQTAEETGLTRGAVTRQLAADAISGSKLGQGVAKATTGISNLAGKTKLGQTWKAIGQTAEETGLTRGAVTRQYAVDRIAGTRKKLQAIIDDYKGKTAKEAVSEGAEVAGKRAASDTATTTMSEVTTAKVVNQEASEAATTTLEKTLKQEASEGASLRVEQHSNTETEVTIKQSGKNVKNVKNTFEVSEVTEEQILGGMSQDVKFYQKYLKKNVNRVPNEFRSRVSKVSDSENLRELQDMYLTVRYKKAMKVELDTATSATSSRKTKSILERVFKQQKKQQVDITTGGNKISLLNEENIEETVRITQESYTKYNKKLSKYYVADEDLFSMSITEKLQRLLELETKHTGGTQKGIISAVKKYGTGAQKGAAAMDFDYIARQYDNIEFKASIDYSSATAAKKAAQSTSTTAKIASDEVTFRQKSENSTIVEYNAGSTNNVTSTASTTNTSNLQTGSTSGAIVVDTTQSNVAAVAAASKPSSNVVSKGNKIQWNNMMNILNIYERQYVGHSE